MVLDRTDVRSAMASYAATTRPTATEFVPCEYVRFYDTEPQETTDGARTWYVRGQNFVLAYTQVQSGAEFTRTSQLDEFHAIRGAGSVGFRIDNVGNLNDLVLAASETLYGAPRFNHE